MPKIADDELQNWSRCCRCGKRLSYESPSGWGWCIPDLCAGPREARTRKTGHNVPAAARGVTPGETGTNLETL